MNAERFLKLSDVCHRIGMKTTVVKDMERRGEFLQPIKINGRGHPRYLESELNDWMQNQIRLNRETAE